MSWTFEAQPGPPWFHQESEHPPPRSKLRPPPSVSRPSPNWSGGDPKLVDGQSAKYGGRVATGLLSPSPKPQGPRANMTSIPQCQELLRRKRESYLPSLFIGRSTAGRQIHLSQWIRSPLGVPPPACCTFPPSITSSFINDCSPIVGWQ